MSAASREQPETAAIVKFNPPAIRRIRGVEVVMDFEIAAAYGVETRVLIQAVKRNADRFPSDFMFQLTSEEDRILKSQFVTSSWGGRRKSITVFTEHGVAMLSGILRSPRAVAVNIRIIRDFIRFRQESDWHGELRKDVDVLKSSVEQIFEILEGMMRELPSAIGFQINPSDGQEPAMDDADTGQDSEAGL